MSCDPYMNLFCIEFNNWSSVYVFAKSALGKRDNELFPTVERKVAVVLWLSKMVLNYDEMLGICNIIAGRLLINQEFHLRSF